MAFAGLRGTGDWSADERPKNFREMILWRDPNGQTPLTALMSKMRSEATDDPEFSWWEEELKPTRVKSHGTDIAAGTTALTLVATDGMGALDLVAGDLLLVEKLEPTTYTFEIVQVSANPTINTSVTVTRGAQGTTAAIIPANSFLLKIGTAFAEGTGAPKATNRNPTKYFNYTQIFKTVYEMTGTAEQTNIRTGDPLGNDKKRRMFDHSVAQELGYLFGFRHEATGANGKPLRYTGGLYQFLASANTASLETIKVWTAMPDEDDLLDAVYPVFDYNAGGIGNERIALCGNGFLNYLNILVKDQASVRINYNGDIKYFGMQLQKWTFPQGTIYLKTHPLMNVNSRFKNGCFWCMVVACATVR
ncbi:MAG: DUF5309 domain-containing protein [Bdellovibrionaceae bacterium]|nr:DUF5309 domain-containing protein [Pseudobdellovibrionaceae bacterium]